MIELKTPTEIAAMRAAGRVVAAALAAVRAQARPGVRLDELDAVAADVAADAGARPSFVGYHPSWAPVPFTGVICASVDDAVLHGVPTRQRLRAGDLLSIDCAVHLDGWCADAAVSFLVDGAPPDPAGTAMIDTAFRALDAAAAAAVPGARLGDVCHAIGTVGRPGGYGLMADHGGHGVGRAMHEAPYVPNEGRPGRGLRLVPGLVLALEPILVEGGSDGYRTDPDGWTLRTADGSRGAHVEHTVAITEDGPLVLTTA